MVSKCLEKCAKYDDRENLAILCWKIPVRAKTRAHAPCAAVFLRNAYKWSETYAKFIWDDLEHFYFLRARWRADVRMRARYFDLKLIGVDNDLNHNKYEWEMPFRYEDMIMSKKYPKKTQNGAWMTSWRLDDLETVPVTSYDNDLWLCQNWTKLTELILSYRRNKKVGTINKNKE